MVKILFVLASACGLQGCAGSLVPASIATGKVDSVYVEEYPGLFIDSRFALGLPDRPRWARVQFAPALPDGQSSAIASVEPTLQLAKGDRVEVRLMQGEGFAAQPAVVVAVIDIVQDAITAIEPRMRSPLLPLRLTEH
ncbi:MAG: hypothetical protein ACKVP2_18405 [Burkholderiales bacterium]